MVEEIHNLSCVIYPYLGSSPPPCYPTDGRDWPVFGAREQPLVTTEQLVSGSADNYKLTI